MTTSGREEDPKLNYESIAAKTIADLPKPHNVLK